MKFENPDWREFLWKESRLANFCSLSIARAQSSIFNNLFPSNIVPLLPLSRSGVPAVIYYRGTERHPRQVHDLLVRREKKLREPGDIVENRRELERFNDSPMKLSLIQSAYQARHRHFPAFIVCIMATSRELNE